MIVILKILGLNTTVATISKKNLYSNNMFFMCLLRD